MPARASASRFSLRRLRPSHRYASAFLGSSSMAFWKSGIAELGAAAQLRGNVVVADAPRHVHHGRLGRLLHGLVDGVLGLWTVSQAAHDVGDGLAVERAEQAIVFGVPGFQCHGLLGELDALLGDLRGRSCGRAVRWPPRPDSNWPGRRGIGLRRSLGVLAAAAVACAASSVKAARSCLSRAISSGDGGAAAAMKAAMKMASMSAIPLLHQRAATRRCTTRKYTATAISTSPFTASTSGAENSGTSQPVTRFPMGIPPRKAKL